MSEKLGRSISEPVLSDGPGAYVARHLRDEVPKGVFTVLKLDPPLSAALLEMQNPGIGFPGFRGPGPGDRSD